MTARALPDAAVRAQTQDRDAQSVTPAGVDFTDTQDWLASLEADARLDAIENKVVWLARTSGIASLQEVAGRYVPSGERQAPGFESVYVAAAYMARGQVHKLSVYCGVARKDAPDDERTQRTAQALSETERRIQTGVSRLDREHGLSVRGGGALRLHNLDEPFVAHPEQRIEALPALTCATCGEAIHYSNAAFRHTATGRAEAQIEEPCPRCSGTGIAEYTLGFSGSGPCGRCHGLKTRLVLDHLADPEVAGRKL